MAACTCPSFQGYSSYSRVFCVWLVPSESKMSILPHQDPGKSVGIPAVGLGTSGSKSELLCPLPLDLCSQVLKGRIWLKMAKIVAYRCILFVRCYLLIGILLFEFQAHISRMSLSQISSSLKIFLCSSQTFANIFFLLWKKVLTSINILII